MNRILIENVRLDGQQKDILIEDNRFSRIVPAGSRLAEGLPSAGLRRIDGSRLAILPPFYNGHTHHAMTLLRGYADDMPLQEWLNNHIWPAEAQMTPGHMKAGVRLAILEMIKSGTVFFNDMYFQWEYCQSAVEEMGVRAVVADSLMHFTPLPQMEAIFDNVRHPERWARNVRFAVAPHAIYTVDADRLRLAAQVAREAGVPLHIHLAETQGEMDDCLAQHGVTPTRWLHQLGVLGPDTVTAHSIFLTEDDMELLARNRVTLVHNPCSNMKLHSGVFPTPDVQRHGLRVALGTDGASSNNNLDMHEEMKTAALLAKLKYSAETLKADEALAWATRNGAEAFGLEAGVIAEGKLADALLVNLDNERLVPDYNLTSNWVYSADSRAIEYVLCDGRVLMEHGRVAGEEQIIEDARRAVADLLRRLGR